MGEVTKIAWTDHTFNPWIGCTRVSEGCRFCYAEAQDQRWKGGVHWGPGALRQVTSPENWKLPLRWNESAAFRGVRERVFCLSLGDWADEEVPDLWRSWLFTLIRCTPALDWQLLTKRMARARSLLRRLHWVDGVATFAAEQYEGDSRFCADPLPNLWIGTTVEDQKAADERIPELLRAPATVRFLSVEPLLEPVNLRRFLPGWGPKALLDWVIVGGESGGHARPMDLSWARDVIAQCRAADVAVFVKQLGVNPYHRIDSVGSGHRATLKVLDSKGGNPSEWPEDLRIREFPEVRHG